MMGLVVLIGLLVAFLCFAFILFQ
ncbi:hypothetical protein KLEP181_gp53 [Paracoccus phage vB_PmaP_KLEP18-1]|nr:hypothetical protein KLEP181_gp53 [Paracoccus phage vB_PmaP_KLEP18-1]